MDTERTTPKWERYYEFRSWLADQLNAHEWKPIDLARRMNPTDPVNAASSISKWMSGKRQPDPASVRILADILGEDVDYALELAGHRPRQTAADDELAAMRRTIKATADKLPRESLRSMLTIMRALLDEETKGDKIPPSMPRRNDSAAVVAVLARGLNRAPACW